MKFRFIDHAKTEFPAHRLCKVLGVSQSGYFAWKDRPASRRQREDMVMLAHVRSAYALSHETYGSPRMTRELQDSGFAIGRRRTARLMPENGLHARQKRRFKRTTDSQHAFPVAPNIIDQDFAATGTNQKWGVDISHIWTREGWLYLSVVIDLFSRRVVGWAVGDRLHRELAISALQKAIIMRRPKPGLVHQSDRGSQYCARSFGAQQTEAAIGVTIRNRLLACGRPKSVRCRASTGATKYAGLSKTKLRIFADLRTNALSLKRSIVAFWRQNNPDLLVGFLAKTASVCGVSVP
jgi:putative transposase